MELSGVEEETRMVIIEETRRAVMEVEEEKWVKHYSSFHQILLVGEGHFSFSLSLARSFGSASNMIATSLDSYSTPSLPLFSFPFLSHPFHEIVIKKYKKAKSNLDCLEKLGASILHGVDATKMKLHADLNMQKFDRIIFNFPHAGFHGKEDNANLMKMYRNLVHGFFKNASGMLHPDGEVHVSHKTTAPFSHWDINGLALQNSLILIECVDFKIEDYPGYNQKRGDGSRCDEPFPLGECSTFKIILSFTARKMPRIAGNAGMSQGSQNIQDVLTNMPHQSISFDSRPPLNIGTCVNGEVPIYFGSPGSIGIRNQCSRIFAGYFKHVIEKFGRMDYDIDLNVHKALNLGFERYMVEGIG